MRPPDDEISKGFRREDLLEAAASEEPTADLDLGGGRRLRLRLPQIPQWMWGVIAMGAGGSGTLFGWFASQDWLGLRTKEELADVRCDLRLAQCGCPVEHVPWCSDHAHELVPDVP